MDIQEIKKIVELMQEHDLTKFELEEEAFRIALARGSGEEVRMVAPMPQQPPSSAATANSAEAAAPAADEEDGLVEIKSPIVGTFYRSGSPETDAYVKVGQSVEPESIVCIVEAMKVMNEIKAEVKGVVSEILVENATPVMYGQPLFKVKPH